MLKLLLHGPLLIASPLLVAPARTQAPTPAPIPTPTPAAPAAPAAQSAPQPASQPASLATSRPARQPLPPGVDAQCLDTSISTVQLCELLVERFGMSQPGQGIISQLVQRKVVAELATAAGIEPTEAAVDERIQQLDAAARAEGAKGGILDHLKRNRLEMGFFRAMLRLGLQQEGLTRAALGLGPEAKLTGAQQDTWLEQTLKERGFELMPRPWKDIVAKSGGSILTRDELGMALRRELPIGDVAEACFQAALMVRLETRMAQGSEAQVERALDQAIARRRSELERNPKFSGISWAQYLQSQGFDEPSFRRDPAVRIEALSHALVDAQLAAQKPDASKTDAGKTAPANADAREANLRAAYEAEKQFFDDRFGEAVRTRMIYLAGKTYFKLLRESDKETKDKELFEKALVSARDELERVAKGIQSEEQFKTHASLVNDDEALRKLEGELGWVTRGDPRVASEVRDAVWKNAPALGATAGRMLGPLALPGGAALLWLGERRPLPEWTDLAQRVHAELRRRLIEELVPKRSLRTFLDEAPAG
ncbi:MAG: hypothetical protein EPO68_02865 [Planctomycetota bacterium]|nr:MAG: hypothetical protein EPO68_02865 [Planctomycetota bacterium]